MIVVTRPDRRMKSTLPIRTSISFDSDDDQRSAPTTIVVRAEITPITYRNNIIATNHLDHRSSTIDDDGNHVEKCVSMYAAETNDHRSIRIQSFNDRRRSNSLVGERISKYEQNGNVDMIDNRQMTSRPIPSPRLLTKNKIEVITEHG